MNYNYYEVLMVTNDAPPEVIRAAYKALLQKWHPDRNSHEAAHEITALLNRAYAELSDSGRRLAYDEWLASGSPDMAQAPSVLKPKGSPFIVDEEKARPVLEKLAARTRWKMSAWQKHAMLNLILGGLIS